MKLVATIVAREERFFGSEPSGPLDDLAAYEEFLSVQVSEVQ